MRQSFRFTGPSCALFAALLIGGCASSGSTGGIGAGGARAEVGLSLAQIDAVTSVARVMTGDSSAQVHGLKSRLTGDRQGTDVCGYVKVAGKNETPLYVELRENNGAVAAERGQIGATPDNLAKVRFQCRKHGEW